MKSMQLTGIRQMECRDVPMPVLKDDNDVLIRMKSVGVCGSDVHYYISGKIGSQVVEYPFSVGHEGAGIVEAVGGAVAHLSAGDRVAIEPAMPCFACDQCLSGRHHTCRTLKFLGCPGQAEGCLSEYIVMPASSCLKIAGSMSFEQASISEPLAIGIYAVQLAGLQPGMKMAILGSGPIGMSVLAAARVAGAEHIYMTDKLDDRLLLASRSGASWTGNVLHQDVVSDIIRLEPLHLDMVFECCGQQNALDQAVELLRPGGKLAVVGIPEFSRFSFPVDALRRKEICIQNVRRQNGCAEKALHQIESGAIQVDHWITHRFPLSECKTAFDLVAGYQDGVMKAMIEI